jgi:hypothetical protein
MFFSIECVGLGSFNSRWLMTIVCLPCLLFALVCAMFGIERCVQRGLAPGEAKRARVQRRDKLIQRLFFVVFLCYPSICKMVFSSFNCLDVEIDRFSGEVETSVLLDDDLVRCEDASHRTMKLLSLLVIVVVSVGVPVFFGSWIFIKARRYETQQQGLAAQQKVAAGTRTLRHEDVNSAHTSAATLALHVSRASWGADGDADVVDPDPTELAAIQTAIRDVTVLSDFAILVESYQPTFVYWEVIDMMRKLALVGLVVLVGRGSVAQIAAGSVLSFGFLALHIKFWPLKCVEDNILRSCAEVHVLVTIVMAFIMKMPPEIMQREKVQDDFYDWVLVTTLVVCLPVCSACALLSKLRRAQQRGLLQGGAGPRAAFERYKLGLASADDRRILREYFEAVGCDTAGGSDTTEATAASQAKNREAAVAALSGGSGWSLAREQQQEDRQDSVEPARVSRSTWSGIPSILAGAEPRDSASSVRGFEMTALSK